MELIISYYHDHIMNVMKWVNPTMTRAEYLEKLNGTQTEVLAWILFILSVLFVGTMAIGLIAYSIHGIIWGKSSKD